MSSPKSLSPPLQERVPLSSNFRRLNDLVILLLLFSLLAYRLATFHNLISIIAFLCESWATFLWFLQINVRWSPIAYKTHPQRLKERFEDLPAVDMFVTTADPTLEPPIITVNTVLSLLAVEYPPRRLACYVSDDGGSPVTYYALREASKFAKLWIPFCKKYNIQVRAPFVYFSVDLQSTVILSSDFVEDWKHMKREYIDLTRKIEGAAKNHGLCHMDNDFVEFSATERGNHPSIVKVIWENNGSEDEIPHLIYVAREKRPKHPHHFKAGAMNVLTRVSGVMTNAPFMLNVDCDMFANNPEVVLHAMCLLLGVDKEEVWSGFVQAPQKFYGALKDDPFGNQLAVLHNIFGFGLAGIQGPLYGGTGCFHRRKIIYGSPPECNQFNDNLSYGQLQRIYGNSRELVESANEISSKKSSGPPVVSDLSSRIAAAMEVSTCTYEFRTSWGKEIGWLYGSVVEDVLTGIQIHAKGWRSAYLTLDPPAFLGNAPTGGPGSLTQYKRWGTGLFEILLGKDSPIQATLHKKLSFRQCLAYLWVLVWAPGSLVEFIYALLPAYCFLTNSAFLPKASSPQFLIPSALFTIYNLSTLTDYLQCSLSARAWWNNQRMNRISSATAFLFSILSVLLKLLGLSETIFEVTKKDQNNSAEDHKDADADPGRFTFDSSPFFVPGTALVVVHIAALATGVVHLLGGKEHCWGLGEFICSAWLILSFWPFVMGFFGKGSHGIPWDIVFKAVGLGWVFLQLCGLGQVN